MLGGVEPDGGERIQVELLRVLGARLDEHLELIVMLQTVRVLAVAAVGRTATGLRIAGAPRLLAEAAQQRRGMEGPRADLGIVGLHDRAAVTRPVGLELEDHVLEGQCVRIHPEPLPLNRVDI